MSVHIKVDDIREAGFCVNGLREFVESQGLDLRKVIRGEYTIEDVQHIDNAYIHRVIEKAQERTGQ